MGERRSVYSDLAGKSVGKRPLRKTRHRWEDDVTMDLQEVGCGGMDWNELAPDRDSWWVLMNAAMNLGLP